MPKESDNFFVMLLILIKRGYACYFLALFYLIIAFMAAFCLHCHSTTIPRNRRDTGEMECSVPNCRDCSGGVNGCLRCKNNYALLIQRDRLHQVMCTRNCPINHFHRRSSRGDICVKCEDTRCKLCGGNSRYCLKCSQDSYLSSGKCYEQCPEGFHSKRFKNECVLNCDDSRCETCDNSPSECTECSRGSFFHSGRCLSKCPTRYRGLKRKKSCVLKRKFFQMRRRRRMCRKISKSNLLRRKCRKRNSKRPPKEINNSRYQGQRTPEAQLPNEHNNKNSVRARHKKIRRQGKTTRT